jgi:hypothetical protein
VTSRVLLALLLSAVLLGSCGKGRGAQGLRGDLESQIKQRVKLSEDPTIFTLFALLNEAGYDYENREAGMHPVRARIRAEVDTLISPEFKARLRTFYTDHSAQANTWTYCVVAKASSGPPDFAPDSVWVKELAGNGEFNNMDKVHALLREFYRKLPIPRLYGEVRKEYKTYIEAYQKAVRTEVTAALAYARIQNVSELTGFGEVKVCVVIPNLLDSFERSSSFVLRDTLFAVEGPQAKVGYNPHEFIHAVTNPAAYDPKLNTLSEKARPLLEALRSAGAGASFRSPAALLDESLVRAVSLRYRFPQAAPDKAASLEHTMLEEYHSGYILERYFWEKLGDYEKGTLTLRQFYPAMLESLDVAKEVKRWQEESGVSGTSGATPDSTTPGSPGSP